MIKKVKQVKSNKIDLSKQLRDLRIEYTRDALDCFHDPKYRIAVAKLWGVIADETNINEHGVFKKPYTEIRIQGNGCVFQIDATQSPNGLWLYGYDLNYGEGGRGCAPSIFNNTAFETLDDLKIHAFEMAMEYFNEKANDAWLSDARRSYARQMVGLIEKENPNQLSLF